MRESKIRAGWVAMAGLCVAGWLGVPVAKGAPLECGPAASLSAFSAGPARWQSLPASPVLPEGVFQSGHVKHGGVDLFYLTAGQGPAVVFLHGGMANSNYLAEQARLIASHHRVILIDSRGHGRSTGGAGKIGYDLIMDDVLAVADHLKLPRFAVVGWSDGAIVGLDLALKHPDRVTRIFAYGANTDPAGNIDHPENNPVIASTTGRDCLEYAQLSPKPEQFETFSRTVMHMWESEPHWTAADLATIHVPVVVADGDHDEMIRQDHTIAIAHTIPGASLLILPDTSHFAFLQAPQLFHAAIVDFLGEKEEGAL